METAPYPSPPATPTARRGPTVETLLYLLIFLLAVVTRYALLDDMALHHDEGIHAKYGWQIYQGDGYTHDAVYHGPLIYHLEALGFVLFGDSDATTRVMLALFSVATVMLPALLRRHLGRYGALLASFLFLISPSFLYFGRFGHPDVFGAFFSLLAFVGTVRYLGERRDFWLYTTVGATCLHFCAKPTAYIFTAILLLFLVARLLWKRYDWYALLPLVGFLPAGIETLWKASRGDFPLPQVQLTAIPAVKSLSWLSLGALLAALVVILGLLGYRWWEGWKRRRRSATLDLVVVLGTMVLPLLSAIPLNLLLQLQGQPALDYHTPQIPAHVVTAAMISIVGTLILAAVIGLLWDVRRWIAAAALFWGIFFTLHTSFFSSMTGWATGLVQALGFWLTQQDVKRIHVGPQYYLILLSAYETVALLFGAVGTVYLAWRNLTPKADRFRPAPSEDEEGPVSSSPPPWVAGPGVSTGLLALWAPAAFLLYSFAGEQVPWLNIHPTLPFILVAAAFVGRILAYRPRGPVPVDRRRWADIILLGLAAALLVWAGRPLLSAASAQGGANQAAGRDGVLALVLWGISVAILLGLAFMAFAGGKGPTGEAALVTLGTTALLMTAINASVLSFQKDYADWLALYVPLGLALAALVVRALLVGKIALRSAALLVFALLCVYGFGSAYRLTYINNDTPVEMLVYVQTSSDLQWAMDQVAALSTLTTGGNDMVFLYDSEVAWPGEWYMRNYPNKNYQGTITGKPPPEAAVALVYKDKDPTSKPYLEGTFVATRYYAFNWWFPEDGYKDARIFVQRMAPEILDCRLGGENEYGFCPVVEWLAPELLEVPPEVSGGLQPPPQITLKHAILALVSPFGQARAWRYLLYREPLAGLGAREFVFYLRQDLVEPLEWLKDSIRRR